jgi:hypothetical protein
LALDIIIPIDKILLIKLNDYSQKIMAADVRIRRWTGSEAGPSYSVITSINTRANAEDTHTTDGTTNSILIPSLGSNYSYWVNTRLYIQTINSGTVDNIKWYTDESNNFGTGVTCIGATAASYGQATGVAGQTGDELTVSNYSHTGAGGGVLNTEPSDVFAYGEGSPLSVTGSATSSGNVGHFVVYQIVVGTTASSGATAAETFTWKYDDTSS